jgi:hypothetical protein
MKKLVTTMAICVAVTLVVLPVAYAQEKGAPPAQQPGGGQAQAERTFEGELAKIDAQAKILVVKGAGDKEMMFDYTDSTEVVGSAKNVQGLAGKTGAPLRITYRAAGGKNTATKIETVEKR